MFSEWGMSLQSSAAGEAHTAPFLTPRQAKLTLLHITHKGKQSSHGSTLHTVAGEAHPSPLYRQERDALKSRLALPGDGGASWCWEPNVFSATKVMTVVCLSEMLG